MRETLEYSMSMSRGSRLGKRTAISYVISGEG